MDFNILVKTQFFPILQKYGFEIKEEFRNILRFQSSDMKLNVAFNQYDRSFLVEIGKRDKTLYPLNDNVVKVLFNSSLPIERVKPEAFVQNLALVFESKKGVEILKGNMESFQGTVILQSGNYTSELISKQLLDVASKAWKNNDYMTFIESMDKLEYGNIPRSYQSKYKIAKQKLKAVK